MGGSRLIAGLRALAWVAIGLLGLWVLLHIRYTLLLFGLATGICYVLYPWVSTVHKQGVFGHHPSWGASVALIFVLLPSTLGVGVIVAIPPVATQIQTLHDSVPSYVEKGQKVLERWQNSFDRLRLPAAVKEHAQTVVANAINEIGEAAAKFFGGLANVVVGTFAWMLVLLVAFIIAQAMLLHVPYIQDHFYDSIPHDYRDEIRDVLHELNHTMGGFLKGMAILAATAGICIWLALSTLTLVNVFVPACPPFDYSLIIGLLAMIAYPIPLVGLGVLTLMSALLAFFQTSSAAYVCLVVSIVVVVFNTVDRLLGPKVMSQAMGVSPLFVMFAALAGAELLGFWGMLLGVPVAAGIKILFRYIKGRFLVPQKGEVGMLALVSALDSLASARRPSVLPTNADEPQQPDREADQPEEASTPA